jgi:DNA polymerase III subunit epsilon
MTLYSIVDIETSGGSAKSDRITEIAIYLTDGIRVLDKFVSLINPECLIPYQITALTGITNHMLDDAPKFFEVARKIVEITENTVFVAHNASFDYRVDSTSKCNFLIYKFIKYIFRVLII